MSAFFGSIVGNLISGLEWMFYSMPAALWFIIAAAALALGIWALGADEFSELLSEGRSMHSFASSFGMGYLFMLVTQAIHPGLNVYAYVTLAKNGMEFSAFDPSTWHITFIIFLILLLVATLGALILAGGISLRQLGLLFALTSLWAVVVRFLESDKLLLIQSVLRFIMSAIVFFATPVALLLSIAFLFSNPRKALQEERKELRRTKHNQHEMYMNMPSTLTLPNGRVVHRTPGASHQPISYSYEGGRYAFSLTGDNIRTLPNGRQEAVIRLNSDDEPEHISIPTPVRIQPKPDK